MEGEGGEEAGGRLIILSGTILKNLSHHSEGNLKFEQGDPFSCIPNRTLLIAIIAHCLETETIYIHVKCLYRGDALKNHK